MKLTKSEKLQLTTKPQKFRTAGAYSHPGDVKNKSYCKCPPDKRVNNWPEKCGRCSRRIRI